MIKKLVSIKNVGRFRDSKAPGNPELSKHTLILGANGYGKTTLCAVLRSLKTGDPAYVLGRKTIDAADTPKVDFLLGSGTARFDGASWSNTVPELSIFDSVFVAENVHSGDVVDIKHRRGLYRVIIGEEGVRLAEKETKIAFKSRANTTDMTNTEARITRHFPANATFEDYIDIPKDPQIGKRIAGQERVVESLRKARRIRERPPLSEITLPKLPSGFSKLLARTIDDVSDDAEAVIANHLSMHGMEAVRTSWIGDGLQHLDGGYCPFCGQDVRGLPLVNAYRTVFSDRYKALREEISAMRDELDQWFGPGALGRLDTVEARNEAAVEFWREHCEFDSAPLKLPAEIRSAMEALGKLAAAALERKYMAPLDPIESRVGKLGTARVAYKEARTKARAVSAAIRAVNAQIDKKKRMTDAGDLGFEQKKLARLTAVRIRHDGRVAKLCESYRRLAARKMKFLRKKKRVRARLGAYTKRVVQPYESSINEHLEAFNAGFRITRTKHAYPGGRAASIYEIDINGRSIDLGDESTPEEEPSFRNTLSSGDRTTLALAFYLASLTQSRDLRDRVAVFDDPFGSQDAFRRNQTVHEIIKLGRQCAQVIVLSHDARFLTQVWDKAPSGGRVALNLADPGTGGTKIQPLNLKRAAQGRMASEIDDLQAYLSSGRGQEIDVVKKLRGVLETYCRTTFPTCFDDSDSLGDIVWKIMNGGDEHPPANLLEHLEPINGYTVPYQHGKRRGDGIPDQIDPVELKGYVRRTLKIVNALQA